jgi:hypothetical protein
VSSFSLSRVTRSASAAALAAFTLAGSSALRAPRAAADPIELEVRVAGGLAAGGGAGRSSVHGAPLVITAGGAIPIRAQPWTLGYANLVIETLDRTGAGGEAGLRVVVSGMRLHAGGKSIMKPYTLHGVTFGVGRCLGLGGVKPCATLAADVFVAGTDLPDQGAVTQLLAGVGLVFDAL